METTSAGLGWACSGWRSGLTVSTPTGAGAASGCGPLCCWLLSVGPCNATDSREGCLFLNKCSFGTDVSSHLRRLPAGSLAWTPEGGCRLQVAWWRGHLCIPTHTSGAALSQCQGPNSNCNHRGACCISSLHRHLGPSPGHREKLQRPQVGARIEALVSWAQNPLVCWQPQRAQSEETGTSV